VAGKVLLGATAVYTLIFIAAYTASFSSIMTRSLPTKPTELNSIDDLAAHGKFHFGTVFQGSTANYLRVISN
jgi:hypothetical protein